jgi:hypothetical protein
MKITKKQIAAKLGTDEAGIARALDDLLSALDEELTKRLAAEAELKATREQLRVASLSASLALSQASQAEADVKRAAQLIKAAQQAPHPARRAKTRRRM